MKLRGAKNFSIGLDLGTASAGWAVADDERQLLTFKGKPTWGSRLFEKADTAADTRVKRGLRRRYDRRRQRLNLLQEFFCDEMQKCDPEFFIRLNQSRLLKEDRDAEHADYRWPLFNDDDFNERDYYERFPTIYHLRKHLMDSNEKADIRLIYLALHNIVKHRGNFLYQDQPSLRAENANTEAAVRRFVVALYAWCDDIETPCPLPEDEDKAVRLIQTVLEDPSVGKRGDRRDKMASIMHFTYEGKADKARGKELANAMLGYKANFGKILHGDYQSFALHDEEKVVDFAEGGLMPDEFAEVLASLQMVYSAFVLKGILKNAEGGTISICKVNEYEQYGKDLKTLKDLVREYAPDSYQDFFRGPFYDGTNEYDVSKAQGYTKYDLGPKKSGYSGGANYDYDAFKKDTLSLFAGTAALEDRRYLDMVERFGDQTFLRRLKTSDNGSIPYQFHLEEMQVILNKQGVFYPFLLNNRDKLTSLVTFRIPYYVGPLTIKNAAKNNGKNRFAWSERVEGKEHEKIYPWNWDEVIDGAKSAEAFIQRMTGTCTYLYGAPVLPKCSLLYEEYCVLNELNGAKWSQDGDRFHRFSYEDRSDMVSELFVNGSVSHIKLKKWLEKRGRKSVRIAGTQDEKAFVSKMGSYVFFKKTLGVDALSSAQRDMAEEIILWNTLFEDRGILKEKVKGKYGDLLSEEQVKKICRKRFTGWGKLSRELLCGLKAQTDDGPKTIMDILREGDPNNSKRFGRAMNLMEILHDDCLRFEELINKHNKKYAEQSGGLNIDDMQGSPALRRSVHQAVKIVDEIIHIAGSEPEAIYIESTREEDERAKGKRTKKRYDQIAEALEAFKKEDPDLWNELKSRDKHEFANNRLALYFIQRGKCMYTGERLDINYLSSYQIDHILPQSLIKDDSLENLVLVKSSANQSKTDKLLLDPAIIRKMRPYWKSMLDAGLIGKKKYHNLTKTEFSDGEIKGFIARQLVETSQIIKFVQQFLGERYPNTKIIPVKASASADLKSTLGIVKCREANDYHHAHDAYIACVLGSFINNWHASILDNPVSTARVVNKLLQEHGEELKKTRKLPGSAGFFSSSFLKQHVDRDTGEFWEPSDEIAKIRRTLDFKSCFITRMPFELTGAFWDQTVYSPKHLKGAAIPLKAGLNPKKYGGYSREQFAYFFIYKAKGRNEKEEFVFAPLPVSIAARAKKEEDALEEYAKTLAKAAGKEFVCIAKKRVLKYQLIEIDGNRYFVTGLKEMRTATQFAFSQNEMKAIMCVLEGKDEDVCAVFETLRRRFAVYSPKLLTALSLESIEPHSLFDNFDSGDKSHVIRELLAIASAAKNRIDLRSLGGAAHAGALSPNYSTLLSGQNHTLIFVDQSVTGMFERKYRLEL